MVSGHYPMVFATDYAWAHSRAGLLNGVVIRVEDEGWVMLVVWRGMVNKGLVGSNPLCFSGVIFLIDGLA